jgi:prolyl oligopeptidase PreP (S9A serine peptidase family)
MFTYGRDADQLYGLMDMLRFARIARGGFAIKRYGEARDPASVEVRVNW